MEPLHSDINHGFVTLLAVLVLGAVGLSIATSLLLVGIGADRSSLVREQGKEADALATACAEEALERIRKNPGDISAVNITLGDGTCTATIIHTGGETRTINATGMVDTVKTRIQITVDAITNNISITSWQNVGDF
ncbi:MAG TPA: hypothetical protein VJA22_01260 [Patescibacteria group bacterium]|nr:hypothetical protein [Patescibacteria group bacterium]